MNKLFFKFYLREAIRQLLSSKLRSFLAMLGILVGTASVVAMISIGELAEHQIVKQFQAMGTNLLSASIYSNNGNSNSFDGLSLANANKLRSISPNIEMVSPYVNVNGSVEFSGHSPQQSSAIGATPEIFSIAKLHLAEGRKISFLDAHHYYAVIGYALAKTLKPYINNQSLLNKQITVGKDIYTIVGVLKKWPTNFFFQTNFNSAVIAPIQTVLDNQSNSDISNIAIRIHNTAQLSHTEKTLKNHIHQETIGQQIQVQSPKSLIDSMKSSSETMTLLLAFIGSISLIVGGIGVMNIMLVSVVERRREIGIRMAIGATSRDIQMQFLVESMALSAIGGLLGVIIGILVTLGVAMYSHWDFTLFWGPIIIGCGISVLIGVFFGFYPAKKASKLDPIQTLRSD